MVTVIVVTYNSSHIIADCLRPLMASDRIRVIVYDNCSDDSTVRVVRTGFPAVDVLVGVANIGFAKAVNAAAREATGSVLLLLNPDAVISAESVLELSSVARLDPTCIIAPRVIDPSGIVRVAGAGRFPTPWRMFTHYFFLSRLLSRYGFAAGHYLSATQLARAGGEVRLEWTSGACMAVNRELWNRLGGLSERWFMYAEDIDLCWRAAQPEPGSRKRRPSCRVRTDITATHLVGKSSVTRVDAREGRPSAEQSAWIIHLFDFYCIAIAGNRLQCATWGVVVSAGLRFRAAVFTIQSWSGGSRGMALAATAWQFRAHAREVFRRTLRATPRGVR